MACHFYSDNDKNSDVLEDNIDWKLQCTLKISLIFCFRKHPDNILKRMNAVDNAYLYFECHKMHRELLDAELSYVVLEMEV